MVRISQCDDLALAMKASQWLVEYAESLRNGKRPAKEETASTVSPNGPANGGYADSGSFGLAPQGRLNCESHC
jgi:hypothetical protein